MFKTEQSVPRVYPERSRDFQLLGRLFDACVNALLGQSNKLKYQLSPKLCDERFTSLLATRLGLVTDEYLPDYVARNLLAVFPYARKNKGNILGLTVSVTAALKTYSSVLVTSREDATGNVVPLSPITVDITNKDGTSEVYELQITIVCSKKFPVDERYLREILKYVLPTGYFIHIIEKDKEENVLSDSYMTL